MATVKWPTRYDARATGSERTIVAEPHTVGEDLPNVIMLYEVPLADVPSTVSITENGTALTEVSGAPAQGEYKVTYTGDLAGLVEFNALDNGAEIVVDYKGRGSNLFARDINNLQAKKLDADGTVAMTGPLDATALKISGTIVVDVARVLQNVTLSGALLTTGTVSDARLSSNVALKNVPAVFTSSLTVGDGTTNAQFWVDGSVSGLKDISWYTGGSIRWTMRSTGAESGGNAGSDWALIRRDDGGAILSQPIQVSRATGVISLAHDTTVTGALTATSFSGSGASLTALNASNLSTGTLADARLSTNVPLKNGSPTFSAGMTVQGTLTAQGPVVLSGSDVTIGNAVEHVANVPNARFFRNLCMLDANGSAIVGAIVIKTAVAAAANRMVQVRVKGFLYDASSPFDLTIGFYHYAGTTPHTWPNSGYLQVGVHNWQVRLAETPDGKVCIILDDVASTHGYPKLWVAEALVSQGAVDTEGDGWSASLVTDLTGYTVITDVVDITTLRWARVSGKPTTLAGYGITDGASLLSANTLTGLQTLEGIAGSVGMQVRVTGDTQPRFRIQYDGPLAWGPGGTSAVDTNLYRAAANFLATDDALSVRGGNLQLLGATTTGKLLQIQNYANTGYHTVNGGTNLEVAAAVGGSVTVKADVAKPTLVVIGQAAQSADLQQWQSSSAVLSVLTKDGWLGIGKTSAATPLDVAGDGVFAGDVSAAMFSGSGANLTNLPWASVTGRPTTLEGYGIVDAVETTQASDWNIISALPQFVSASANGHNGITVYQGVHMPHPAGTFALQLAGRNGAYFVRSLENSIWGAWSQLWHEGNDGPGSTLNADLLDGQEGSYYQNASNINAGTLSDSRLSTNVAKLNAAPTFTAGLKISGSYITIQAPSGTAGWSLGFAFKESDESTQFGGIGMYGSATNSVSTVTNLYVAHGANPHNSGLGIYVLPSGYVGIGKTAPGSPLDVNGNTAITGTLAVTGTISQNGTAVALTGASYTKAQADAQFAPIGLTSISTYDGGTDATTGRTIDRSTSDYKKIVTAEFKTRASLSIPGSGTYASVLTVSTYTDSGGGATVGQWAFAGNVVSFRSGTIGSAWAAWNTFWHNGNDGSGSTLDADLLDGQHGSYYQNASNINAGTVADARLTTNVPLKNATNAFTGANSFTTVPTVGGTAVALVGASYTKTEADGRFLRLTGGTLTAAVTVPEIYLGSDTTVNVHLNNDLANRLHLTFAGGTGTLLVDGTIASSALKTTGSDAAVFFDDRTGGAAHLFAWYATGNVARFFSQGVGADILTIDESGKLTTSGDVTAFSDRRKKTDLAPLAAVSTKLRRLSAYTFTRTDTGERGLGLIAQDVQPIFPEAVHTTSDGYLTLAYGNLVAPLIVAHNEHSEKFETVDTELAALRARVAQLESLLQVH